MNHQSQRNRIYALLKENEGRRVSLSTILDLRIANYRARISELRQEGHTILCEKQRQDDGSIHSWYTLNPTKLRAVHVETTRSIDSGDSRGVPNLFSSAETGTLFGDD